ncbi:MAG: (d)CMP kinase, partial [Puniceicoccales bacterium]
GFRGLIMEGRDIGSVIFPDADLRIFLEADAATRAERRAADGEQDSVEARDKIDSSRKAAPLTCPEGALRIDNSNLTLDEVVDEIVAAAAAKSAL